MVDGVTIDRNVTGNLAITARGHTIGWEYYGTFLRALYTLFQVFTGESWSEAVARPLVFGLYRSNAVFVSFFFVSFIILTQIILANVVVAVLLDKFVENEPEAKEEPPPSADDFLGGISEDPSQDVNTPVPSTPGAQQPNLPQAVALPRSSGPPSQRPADANGKLDAVLTELALLRSSMTQLTTEMRCCREDIDLLRQGGAPGPSGMSA